MMEFIVNLDWFSRVFCTWYFDNKSMSYSLCCAYLDNMIAFIYHVTNIKLDKEDDSCNDSSRDKEDANRSCDGSCDKDDVKRRENESYCCNDNKCNDNRVNKNTIESENMTDFELVDLEDSKEIEELDKFLGKLFCDKFMLQKSEKQKIAKVCDTFEQIMINNEINNKEYFVKIVRLLDLDSLLYKKFFRIIKICKDEDVLLHALTHYKNTWRNANFFASRLSTKQFLEATNSPNATLEYLDLNLICKEDLWDFILNNEFELEILNPLIMHCLKKEDNLEIKKQIKNKISHTTE